MIDVTALHHPMPELHRMIANILGMAALAFAGRWCVVSLWPRRATSTEDDADA